MRRRPSPLATTALVLLPALLVAGGYAFWSGLPLRATVAATEHQIREIELRLPSAQEMQDVQARADELRSELAAVLAARQPAPGAGGGTFVGNPERAQWRLALSDALQRHELTLLAEERIETDLPPNIARGLTGAAAARTHLSTWSLKLRGGYLDLLAAVTALREQSLPFYLLELAMKRDGAGAVTWTLVVG